MAPVNKGNRQAGTAGRAVRTANPPDLHGDSSCSSAQYSCGDSSVGDGSKQYARVNRMILDKESEEYRKRRERNNMAVKRSRQKSKTKTMLTQERVNQLRKENESLTKKIEILSKELSFLKELFMNHSKMPGQQQQSGDQNVMTNL